MLKNGRNRFYEECSCHHSKNHRRKSKHTARRVEQQVWLSDIEAEKASAVDEANYFDFEDESCWWIDLWDGRVFYDEHIYEAERCVYCNSNVYDNAIYGDDGCIPNREPMVYTTESTP